jgi:glutathione S-transferase
MALPLLVIGNKKYSSWSLRAWIAFRHLGVPFEERRIPLYQPQSRAEILKYSAAGKVPALVDGPLTVHESIAILEYLNETHAQDRLLPRDVPTRARIRSVSAEMHAGFPNLRQNLPMNLARSPAPLALDDATRAETLRILSLWESLRVEFKDGGPYLFGAFSMADCMYLPVATRFHTYMLDLTAYPRARGYYESLMGLPAFQEWRQAGVTEKEVLPQFEK